jgi:hypothetical protein
MVHESKQYHDTQLKYLSLPTTKEHVEEPRSLAASSSIVVESIHLRVLLLAYIIHNLASLICTSEQVMGPVLRVDLNEFVDTSSTIGS